MPLRIVRFVNEGGIAEFHFNGADGWDDFDVIAAAFRTLFDGEVVDQLAGEDVKSLTIRKGGIWLKLRHNGEVGNWITSTEGSEAAERLAEQMARKIADSITAT